MVHLVAASWVQDAESGSHTSVLALRERITNSQEARFKFMEFALENVAVRNLFLQLFRSSPANYYLMTAYQVLVAQASIRAQHQGIYRAPKINKERKFISL
jgi:hypothetical protein